MNTPEQQQEKLEDNARQITENIGNPEMALYIHTSHHQRWSASHPEIRAMLGCPTPELPDAGMQSQMIQGILVWIEPKDKTLRSTAGQKFFHRVLAKCPVCFQIMSVARLQQHSKVHLKAALNKALDEAGVSK